MRKAAGRVRALLPIPPNTLWNGPRVFLGEAQVGIPGFPTSPVPQVDWAALGCWPTWVIEGSHSVREQSRWVTSRIYSVLHFVRKKKTMNEPLCTVSVVCPERSITSLPLSHLLTELQPHCLYYLSSRTKHPALWSLHWLFCASNASS